MKEMLRSLKALTHLEFQEKYPVFRITSHWWEEIRCVYAKWLELFETITCERMESYISGPVHHQVIVDLIGKEAVQEKFQHACASIGLKKKERKEVFQVMAMHGYIVMIG